MNKYDNLIARIISNIIQGFQSIFWHRDKSIILFGAWFGTRFADNPRYLFQFLSANKEKYGFSHVVWVTRDKDVHDTLVDMGYECYMMDSEESVSFHKKAYYQVLCENHGDGKHGRGDINVNYSYGAIKIDTWHGVGGIKGVGFSSLDYKKQKETHKISYGIREFLVKHSVLYRKLVINIGGWGDCYYISTTPSQSDIYYSYFLLPYSHYIEAGYPRTCDCSEYTPKEKALFKRIEGFKLCMLYVPTFRSNKDDFEGNNLANTFSTFFEEHNIVWIQKFHSADLYNTGIEQKSDNVIDIDNECDINVLIPMVDYVITDYSSVMVDAVYHDKGLLFYTPDYDQYVSGDRGFILSPEDMLCGPIAKNIDGFKTILENILIDPEYGMKKDKRDMIFSRYWGSKPSIAEIWEKVSKAINR